MTTTAQDREGREPSLVTWPVAIYWIAMGALGVAISDLSLWRWILFITIAVVIWLAGQAQGRIETPEPTNEAL